MKFRTNFFSRPY